MQNVQLEASFETCFSYTQKQSYAYIFISLFLTYTRANKQKMNNRTNHQISEKYTTHFRLHLMRIKRMGNAFNLQNRFLIRYAIN